MNNHLLNVDLNLLKTLDVLLDERSVTRAAERLSLTQPAVSGMLTRLRESLMIRCLSGLNAASCRLCGCWNWPGR